MTVPTDLDRRFRETAARSRAARRGLRRDRQRARPAARCRDRPGPRRASRSTPSPSSELESLAQLAGRRVLRSPRALDETRRELDDYFGGRRTRVRPRPRHARPPRVHAARPLRAREGAVRPDRDLRRARRARRQSPRLSRRRHGDEPEPHPDRAPVPPHRRRRPARSSATAAVSTRKERLLRLEGAML